MSFEDAINAMSGNKKTDKEHAEEILKNPNKAVRFYESLNDKMNKTKGLSKWFEAVDTIGDMVVDYAKGNYREVPLNTIIGATAALIYFLSPIDVLPDVVASLGQLDDIAVIAFAVKSISHNLDKYKDWKASRSIKVVPEISDEVVQKALEFAKSHNLVCSVGSDFHFDDAIRPSIGFKNWDIEFSRADAYVILDYLSN